MVAVLTPTCSATSATDKQRWKPVAGDNQGECRIASSRNAPEQAVHCLTRMLPTPRHVVNRCWIEIRRLGVAGRPQGDSQAATLTLTPERPLLVGGAVAQIPHSSSIDEPAFPSPTSPTAPYFAPLGRSGSRLSIEKRWTERLCRVMSDRAIGAVGGQVYPFDPAGMGWEPITNRGQGCCLPLS
jgi:hypothetical protein